MWSVVSSSRPSGRVGSNEPVSLSTMRSRQLACRPSQCDKAGMLNVRHCSGRVGSLEQCAPPWRPCVVGCWLVGLLRAIKLARPMCATVAVEYVREKAVQQRKRSRPEIDQNRTEIDFFAQAGSTWVASRSFVSLLGSPSRSAR